MPRFFVAMETDTGTHSPVVGPAGRHTHLSRTCFGILSPFPAFGACMSSQKDVGVAIDA